MSRQQSLFLFWLLFASCEMFTLNVPNVLLPIHSPDTIYTNFTLTADMGCFNWLSTKDMVVGIKPLIETGTNREGCSQEAELTALSQDPSRQLSLILAHETGTGSELRVDVFVDVITRIAIKTTSLELLLEETPSTFEVVAFDDDGNTFSTLEGLEFTWTIEPDETHVSGNVLRNIAYTDSSYLTPPTIGYLEEQGKQGEKILVQGINTGVAWVRTRLSHPSYQAVKEVSVRVVVIENLLLNPPYDVWVLTHTQISYKAERRQHGRKTEIQFPSDQYSMTVSNTTVAEITSTLVTTLVIGDTDVVLIDKNVQHLPLGTPPHTTVHVVPPSALLFKIDHDNWNFEAGKKYTFSITVLGPNNRPILLRSDNIRIKITVEDSYVTVLESNTLGTEHMVLAKETGVTKITAVLDTLIHPRTGEEHPVDPAVTSHQTLVIRSPIAVVPARVVLPLYRVQPYTYKLLGQGGSGQYSWKSDSSSRVAVNKEGLVTAKEEGNVVVSAADRKNSENLDTAEVIVAELSGLAFLPAKVETLVATSLRLNLAAYLELEPGMKVPFTRCDMVPLVYSLSNDLFVLENEEKPTGDFAKGVCSILTVRAVRPGNALVKVSYTTSRQQQLTATITIASYPPLTLLQPDHVPVLTLGSSSVLALSGGPQPWVLDKSGYTQHMSTSPGYLAVLAASQTPAKLAYGVTHNFRVTCSQLGVQSGMVVVANKVSKENRYPASESLKVKVRCDVPSLLSLSHELPTSPPGCPSSVQIPVMAGQDVRLQFSVRTSDHLSFDNSSSLLFEFESSDRKRLSVDEWTLSGLVSSHSDAVSHLHKQPGSVEVSLTVQNYEGRYISGLGVSSQLETTLEQSLKFKLVKELSISPASVTMFNYEEGVKTMTVTGGSGDFTVTSDNHDVIAMSATSSSPFTIRPKLQGITTVTVQDLCLPGQITRSKVHVTGPAEVQIKSVSKVEVQGSIYLTLSIIDSNQRKISSAVFSKLHLHHSISDNHITLLAAAPDDELCEDFCTTYRVDGVSLGTSAVQFTVSGGSEVVKSNVLMITVFAPLVLTPSPLILVEGAVFQIRYSGGPPHDSTLHFSSPNTTTATINQRALVTGRRVGNVEVVGRCVGTRTDSDVLYSQASVSVQVIKLEGIELRSPSTYILENGEVPLTVWGVDNNGPFTFASVSGISFSWTASSSALALLSLYDKSGYNVEDEHQFTVAVHGERAGLAVVTVTVSYTDSGKKTVSYSDTISIQVVKKALLISPPPSPASSPALLLGPGAVYNVKTNKDHTNTVHYSVLEGRSAVGVSQDGTVQAWRLGTATLRIDVVEDHNINQTLLLHVQVKIPFVIQVKESEVTSHKAQSDYPYFTLPVGLATSFLILTRDELGREFDSITKTPYHYTFNRLDVISVVSLQSNDSLSITGQQVGETVIKLRNEAGLEGWAYIRVSAPLEVPLFSVLHKTTVCIPHLQEDEDEWRSDDETVASVRGALVTAASVGSTLLKRRVTSATHSIVKVEVVKVESVTLSPSSDTRLLSNIATAKAVSRHALPVAITTSKPLSRLAPTCGEETNQEIEFRCTTSHPGVLTATADLENSRCIVTALPNSAVSAISPLVTVEVEGAVSASIQVPFAPRFKLSSSHVTVSPSVPTADIALVEGELALVQLALDGNSAEDLNVIKTSTHIHVSLLKWSTEATHSLTFICQNTGQIEVLDVTIMSPAAHIAPIKLEFSNLTGKILPTAILGLLVLGIVLGILLLTTASYRRLTTTHTTDHVTGFCHVTTPSPNKMGSPFRPATISPARLKTPLYTKPHGTPGTT